MCFVYGEVLQIMCTPCMIYQKVLNKDVARHDVHLRFANKLQKLWLKNGGIYIKFGQHIG
jgi:predicted unusual protein kinase regulating ubiquinone biosynthesis (AarF/ABC1/UbiB family)